MNGHTDTPCTLIHAPHSCHVHVCMCVINIFYRSVYPSVRHSFPSSLFTWGLTYGCAHLARLRLRVQLGCTSTVLPRPSVSCTALQGGRAFVAPQAHPSRPCSQKRRHPGQLFLHLQGASVHGCRSARASAAGSHTHFGIVWVDCCALRLLRCKHMWCKTLLHQVQCNCRQGLYGPCRNRGTMLRMHVSGLQACTNRPLGAMPEVQLSGAW